MSECRSLTVTSLPALATVSAATSPAGPPPTTWRRELDPEAATAPSTVSPLIGHPNVQGDGDGFLYVQARRPTVTAHHLRCSPHSPMAARLTARHTVTADRSAATARLVHHGQARGAMLVELHANLFNRLICGTARRRGP